MTDHDDFDAEGLRRLDVPSRPAADADARIRSAMLDAFDAASSGVEVISLDEQRELRRRRRWPYLATVACLIVVVALGVVLTTDDRVDVTDFAEQNRAAVAGFCTGPFADLDDDLLAFVAARGSVIGVLEGQRGRTITDTELLARSYTDLAAELGGPLGPQVAVRGEALLERAAAIRRSVDLDQAPDDAALEELIRDLAIAVEGLPGASACVTAPLKDEG